MKRLVILLLLTLTSPDIKLMPRSPENSMTFPASRSERKRAFVAGTPGGMTTFKLKPEPGPICVVIGYNGSPHAERMGAGIH
ncbi:MAG: hypothetical protein L7T84_13090 [Akkermansiaceae bacterium]|nr:hypothetical protein [Akkermansiaceae bacterium]MCH1510136.1 hypothetical protein [Akkermansiaceae bacterium]